ncbi:MAG: PD40 domain-containing protein [Planctomycetes bacterium]|nr:PD40 domain-containing protein [Planctomycetota bacterium]
MLNALLSLVLTCAQSDGTAEVIRLHRAADASLVAGDGRKAAEQFTAALALAPEQPTLLYGLACAWARAGERELALVTLNRVADQGYADAALAEWDPDLASVRGDPLWPAKLHATPPSTRFFHAEPVRKLFDTTGEWSIVGAAVDRTGTLAALAINHLEHDEGVVDLLDARTGKRVRRIATFASQVWTLALDATGTRIGVLTSDGAFWLVGLDLSSPPREVGRIGGTRARDRWSSGASVLPSPDGQRWFVAASGFGALLCGERGERIPIWQVASLDHVLVAADWSPDGKLIAWAPLGQVRFFDADTGRESAPMIATDSLVLCLRFHPDGRRLVTGHQDAHARVWDLETRRTLLDEPFPGIVLGLETAKPLLDDSFHDMWASSSSIADARFSPDGSRLAYSTVSGVFVVVLDLASKHRIYESGHLGGRMGEPAELTWSGDSRRVWHSFASSVCELDGVELEPKVRELGMRVDSGPVRAGSSGVGISIHYEGAHGIDTGTGFVLWRRAAPGAIAEFVHTPEGYFTSDSDDVGDLANYRIRLDDDARDVAPRPLTDRALALFDPKRVRARAAGIELAVPKL